MASVVDEVTALLLRLIRRSRVARARDRAEISFFSTITCYPLGEAIASVTQSSATAPPRT